MNNNWEIWLNDANGTRVSLLEQVISFGVVHNANEVGAFSVSLPYSKALRDAILLDSLVEFWRAPAGGTMKLEALGLARKFGYVQGNGGDVVLVVSGPDQHELLQRRIVAYNAGSSYTSKSGKADNLMKDVINENFVAATDADRNWTNIAIESDLDLGQSIDLGFSRTNVLEVLKRMAKASDQAGTPLYFRLAPVVGSTISYQFQVRANYLGEDRVEGGEPVMFGEELGNLGGCSLVEDYSDEITVVYGGGPGEEDYRYVYEVEDATRTAASPYNRREKYVDARNLTKPEVQNKAKLALVEGEPKTKFSGQLLEGVNSLYGLHWGFGDRVSCTFAGITFTGMVKAVALDVDESGIETITARMET